MQKLKLANALKNCTSLKRKNVLKFTCTGNGRHSAMNNNACRQTKHTSIYAGVQVLTKIRKFTNE